MRGVLWRSESTRIVFGRGSAPDPAGGAYNAPPDPLVGWGGGTPSTFLSPQRLRRFGLGTFGASILTPSALRFSPPNCKSWRRHWYCFESNLAKHCLMHVSFRRFIFFFGDMGHIVHVNDISSFLHYDQEAWKKFGWLTLIRRPLWRRLAGECVAYGIQLGYNKCVAKCPNSVCLSPGPVFLPSAICSVIFRSCIFSASA